MRPHDSGFWCFLMPRTLLDGGMIDEEGIRQRWQNVGSKLNERERRIFAASEVVAAGRGGLAIVSRITKMAISTILRGKADLEREPLPEGQVRRKGGGRRRAAEKNPELVLALKKLVEPATCGDPMQPLLWVSKSRKKLAKALRSMGHKVSPNTIAKELVKLGFSRQTNRKTDEGSSHPDRDAQFE